ncbi:hypothetical protein COCON_G00226400 [Conger conger]|uniref:PH domain-containing protein n=1 Tax=Conger conger TaxID=82655 RepID=A0A9Q1CX30_CONCO|nr:hypothetical protein COCON_G00226400 [Conger conger]
MGEQLLCRPNPAADQVRKQLGQLRDQWQALKQAAAGQSRVAGGARNMQEFNRKVDRLEAWIKEKQEEEECLAKLQGENIDRMQLTRRILDLKQDEQLYRSLHEEINHLALKLEKQGKTEGKNISARRKHINKMWQKVQALLKDYHETLQLALEVSSFYQQADNIITAISNKRKSVSVWSEREGSGDREIRDIGSQVMMLEVTVSQLSKLHPALAERVFQKQGEVKEGWTLLQKAVRNEKSALPPTSPDFSRRDEDPLTPCKEQQCSMGAETQRMMGKDIKEEQNRLKGHVSVGNSGRNRKSTGTQEEELLSQSHAPSGTGSSIVRADDITGRPRSGRDRKQTSQSKPGTLPGQAQPRPQMHTQLQKFTVSADKTLSWLKDNVAMATQTCCPATRDGQEAARRRQAALEQEIQSNAARIELVKKEGRGLVRAGHPGSRKIGQFLEQLEALWEELKRRHRRNLHLLQEAERLSIEQAVRVLLQLDSLERGLQTVEAALGGRRGAGDPQNVTAAEQQSSELEREVSARGLQLRSLRQDVERLRRHLQTPQLPLRLEQVEERFRRVQSALTQQSSELRDTRMLTEFLERVELEESQAQQGRCYGDLPQSLHSDAGCRVSVLGLQGHRAGEPLLEGMGDPVEELREAVEMLNDTVRERGRSLCQEQDLQELLSRHSSLTARIAQRLSRAAQLGEDVQGAESDMAVRCEPERSGLEALQEQQEEQETELAGLEREAEEVTALAAQLEEQCPERVQDLAPALRTTLQASAQLRRRCAENRARLRKFTQLRCFFRKYLAMISWTEDTRDRIFSESAVHDGTGSERPEASEMDEKIEQKFRDFDDLAVAGQSLMDAGHHLTELIQERMEELRSMLGWILVRWRSQKHQKKNGRKGKAEPKGDNIYSEATVSPAQQSELQGLAGAPANQPAASPGCHDKLLQTEGGYEVMSSMGLWGGASDTPSPQAPPLVLTQETSPPALGGAVNLILSFSAPGDPQGDTPAGWAETEPVHRGQQIRCRRECYPATPFLPRPGARLFVILLLLVLAGVGRPRPVPRPRPRPGHARPGSSGSSVLSGLKLRTKRRKRKRDARRHTIQRIMGMEPAEGGAGACSTHTWPLKDRQRTDGEDGEDATGYLRNPLSRDIDAECTGQSDYAASLTAPASPGRNCRHLSLGSVLTFDLRKDAAVIPSAPDIITIGPAEPSGTGPDPRPERTAPFSTFKLRRSRPARLGPQAREGGSLQNDCSLPNPKPNQSEQRQSMLSRLSGISSLQEEVVQEWDKMAAVLDGQRRDPKSSASTRAHQWPTPLTDPPHAPPQTPEPPLPPSWAVLSLEKPAVSGSGAVPPDRRQFEEEEEELEGIWGNRQSICSDVMYQLAWTPPGHAHEPRPQEAALLYRKLVTASAPELRLPTEGPHPDPNPDPHPDPDPHPRKSRSPKPHRKSWAHFLSSALSCGGQSGLVNETAADCVTLPHVQDQEKYIYQYREQEEEEEEEEEEEGGVEADTGCPKVRGQSSSPWRALWRGSTDCSRAGRRPPVEPGAPPTPCCTGMHRHTLCFYQDRKHTLRSSEPGLPLSLLGAECSPAPEYTKRSNCFSLQLRDGSEFLLSASSRFLMRKWLLKIQANSGLSESDPSRSFSEPGSQDNLPITQSHTGTARDKEIIVLTRAGTQNAPQHHGILEDLSPRSSSDAGHSDSYSSLRRAVKQRLSQRPRFGDPSPSDSLGRPSSKRRSQSFTSATYQKISPVRPNPAARGGGSSYSVTLVIGDEATPTIAEKPQLIGWRQEAFQDSPGGGVTPASPDRETAPRLKSHLCVKFLTLRMRTTLL